MSRRRLPILVLAIALVITIGGVLAWLAGDRAGRDGAAPAGASAPAMALDSPSSLARPPASVARDAATETDPGRPGEPGSEPPVAAEAPPAGRALLGRVLDARTGEEVPGFALVVWQEGLSEDRLVTDARGAFATEPRFAPGKFSISLDDDSARESDGPPLELVFDDLDLVQELRLEVGPTYRLDVHAPAPLVATDFLAVAGGENQPPRINVGDYYDVPVRAALGGVGPAWVRFHPGAIEDAVGPWRLELVSTDGFHYGAAPVDAVVGVYPGVVTVPVEARAAVRIEARDAEQQPVSAAWARLARTDGGERYQQWFLAEGTHLFRALTPGRWRVEVDSYEHETHAVELDLAAGRLTNHAVELRALAGAGGVSGRVTSATGTYRCEGEIALWPHAGSKSNQRRRLKWVEADGGLVSQFDFEDVPAGTYELAWVAPDCPFDVLPGARQLVTVPAHEVEIRVLDDVPTLPVEFRARDAATGEPLTIGAWWMAPGGWARWERALEPGAVAVEAWPVGRDLLWIVRGPSGGIAHGDARDLVREGERLVVDVALEPGWGVQLFLADPDGVYVEGVTLAFDGIEVGPSGPLGRLPVSLARRPTTIEVRTPGWRLPGGAASGPALAFDIDNWWALGFELERAPR